MPSRLANFGAGKCPPKLWAKPIDLCFSGKDLEALLHGEGRSACISYSQVWKDLVKDIPMNLKDFLLGRKLFEGIRDKTGEYDECQRRYYPDWNR